MEDIHSTYNMYRFFIGTFPYDVTLSFIMNVPPTTRRKTRQMLGSRGQSLAVE